MKGVINASKSCEAWVDAAGIVVTRVKKTKGRETRPGPLPVRLNRRTEPILPTFELDARAFILKSYWV